MRKLIKLLFGLIIFVFVLVGIPFIILYVTINDSTDNTNYALYNENVTMESVITNLFDQGFNLEDKDSIDLTFTQDEINKFIFAYIRQNVNDQYLPSDKKTDDVVKNIKTMYIDLPVLGGQKVEIKSIYAEIKEGKLEISVPMKFFGFKTRARIAAKFEETNDSFVIDLETLGMGKSNLLKGLSNSIVKKFVSDKDINTTFEKEGLPIKFELTEAKLFIDKEKINDLVLKLLNPDNMSESNEKSFLRELMVTLTDKDNDLIHFGVFKNQFGFKFDLTKFKVSDSLSQLSSKITDFNKADFMKFKTQGLAISNIISSSKKVTFSNLEFNQLVYNYTNGYESFKFNFDIPGSTTKMNFEITGIIFDFNTQDVQIRINFILNGLKSSFILTGALNQQNNKEIIISINDKITLGQDVNEQVGEYIIANSSMILSMIGENMGDTGVITYSSSLKAFILNAESFTKLMSVNDNDTPLTVDTIKIIDNFLEIYVSLDSSSSLNNVLTDATSDILNALSSNIFDLQDFETDDSQELESVNNLLSTLDSISDSINNSTLSDEQTNQLLIDLNNLSPENRNIFMSGLENSIGNLNLGTLTDGIFSN